LCFSTTVLSVSEDTFSTPLPRIVPGTLRRVGEAPELGSTALAGREPVLPQGLLFGQWIEHAR